MYRENRNPCKVQVGHDGQLIALNPQTCFWEARIWKIGTEGYTPRPGSCLLRNSFLSKIVWNLHKWPMFVLLVFASLPCFLDYSSAVLLRDPCDTIDYVLCIT